MKNRVLVLIIVLLQLIGGLFAQDARIFTEMIEGSQVKKRVEFVDDNKIIKTIDFAIDNPYNKLDYEIDKTNARGQVYYKNIPYSKLFPNKSDFDMDKIKGIENVYGFSNFVVYKLESCVLLIYSLGSRYGDIYTGSYTTIRIYSLNGDLIKTYDNLLNIGSVRLTESLNYMLYSYGNDMGDQSVIKEGMGIRIYNTKRDEPLIDRKFDGGFQPNNHYARGNFFVISSTKWGKEKMDKLQIVHFEDRKIYTKIMPRPERIRVKNITDDGFILRNTDISKDDIELSYEKDFLMEDF